MKENLRSWFHGLDHEEGFPPVEVFSSDVGNKQNYTHVIVSEINQAEMRENFVEDIVL